MSKQHERIELNTLITEDALLSNWTATTEVGGSIEALPPGPAVIIVRGGTFDWAVPSIGPGATTGSLLKKAS